VKVCIVNGDDFGLSPGVNRGIVDAHRHGVLTSASLLVDTPFAADAARQGRTHPRLSLGLHAALTRDDARASRDERRRRCRCALEAQLERFEALLGAPPTHLDSHHNDHRDPVLLPVFLEVSERWRIPLRGHSPVRYLPDFYGRWDGESHPEQVSAEQLTQMLECEVGEGVTELACHPGYVDAHLDSSYATERELELRALRDAGVRRRVEELGIVLASFRDVGGAGRRGAWPAS
jgi:predicted glycoside hydrolase/deacetylase ChbG (UPF0249 family)